MTHIIFGKYEPRREIVIIDQKSGNSMQHIYEFANGYGANVIQNEYSKGNENGLYELGVLKDGVLCCNTPIETDVIGYLSADEVAEYLQRIEELPKEGE
nr:MAG TPA: hypothetical protein [Caudoviricetes sp.]